MRIVVVKAVLPYPPDQGTKVVTLALLQALARRHDVTLCTSLLDARDARFVPEVERTGARVRTVVAPNRRSVLHRALYKIGWIGQSVLGGVPTPVYYSAHGALRRLVREVTRDTPADVAVVEYWYLAPLLPDIHARRMVLLAHDADTEVNRLRRTTSRGPIRWLRAVQHARAARWETRAFQNVDAVLTLTDADRDAVASTLEEAGGPRPPVRVLPIPLTRPVTAGSSLDGAPSPTVRDPRLVLLYGAFTADFNRDGADWFLRDVLPKIHPAVPDVRVVIGGSGDLTRIARAARGRPVEVVGYLTDLDEWLRRAAAVVLPLRFGGGLHIRLVEAMAQGAAVVSTSLGVRGLPLADGREILVADDAAGFAEGVVRLLRDPALRTHIGEAAGARARQLFAREEQEVRMLEVFETLARTLRPRGGDPAVGEPAGMPRSGAPRNRTGASSTPHVGAVRRSR
jgi:glycosyltransferase involved in cell wall biosynthesis